MPARPVEHRDDAQAVVYVRLPGREKNRCVAAAEAAGMTVTAWAANVLRAAALGELGVPAPPPAVTPLPEPAEALAAWATGQRLIGPCGDTWPCRAAGEPLELVCGVSYCACGIRVG